MRRVTITCPKPCGRPVGRMQVLCEEHERVVTRAIQQRMFRAEQRGEIQQMVYERLLGPDGLSRYHEQKNFRHWLRDHARAAIKLFIAREARKRLVDLDDRALLSPPADPESWRCLRGLLGHARASYVADPL